jgi:uncharacterized protein (TIGR02145 family)
MHYKKILTDKLKINGMKKSVIIFMFIVGFLNAQAQNYLISFAGSGAATIIGNVKVDNLNSGAAVTLNGGDVLHLIPAVGIDATDPGKGGMRIYPNPMTDHSTLAFFAPENGDVTLSIHNISGKTEYQTGLFLSAGICNIRVSGVRAGMYLIKVTGKNYNYTGKLTSLGNLQGEVKTEYRATDNSFTGSQYKSAGSIIEMMYTDGDQLIFKGTSGIYSTIVPDVPTGSKTITFVFVPCTDSDGNHYPVVKIGPQTWMAENINVGIRVNGTQNQIATNGIKEKYCNNDLESNCDIYGGLYQWDEMMQGSATPGVQGICPSGWHVPTESEWTTLTGNLGGEFVAAGKLKETGTTHWDYPNTDATNESGFGALPGDLRYLDGSYGWIGAIGYWWGSTQNFSPDAWFRYINNDSPVISIGSGSKLHGISVRCMHN